MSTHATPERILSGSAGPSVSASRQGLRPWQAAALPIIREALTEGRRGLVEAVMGAGKSVLIREVLRDHLDAGGARPVVVTTSSVKLVEQLQATFSAVLPSVGAYYTGAKDTTSDVIVCCNASAAALAEALPPQTRIGLWVADEAHRTEAAGLLEMAEALDPLARLAVTATPFRSGGERISQFDEVLYSYTPADALRDGVIVPWTIRGWEGAAVPVDEAAVALIRRFASGPGIANASTIGDAEHFAAVLADDGLRAAPVHSHMSRAVQNERIERLRVGDLDVLVHVNLLAEGVDLPWLRWLCLRRPVGARVRFVQEVGRVLRAFPGKTHALLLDPLDLFSTFGLNYEAALGWEPPPEPTEARELDDERAPRNPLERFARQISSVGSWARGLTLALQAEGVCEPSKVAGSAWRNQPPSERQVAALARMRWTARFLPDEHAKAVHDVTETPEVLTRGIVGDLMSVLIALGARKALWVPAVEVALPSIPVVRDGRWRCAAVLGEGTAAVAVMHGDRIVYKGARAARSGDTLDRLRAAAARLARERGAEVVLEDDPQAARVAAYAASAGVLS